VKSADPGSLTPARLGDLCAAFRLSEHQESQLLVILQRIATDARAPTSVRDPERAVDVHLADSLVAMELDALSTPRQIADIGPGAGFPGLALAVALPASEVWLVEAQARKCAFMEEVCAVAQIANARVVCARAEDWSEGIAVNDVVLARAVGPQATVVEYAAPLLRSGGALIDWRGRRDHAAETAGERAARQLGLERTAIRRVEPYPGVRDHHLHVYTKVRETPPGFPRRAGMARRRPLGE
jgi:16S rRNA (guanine527-N7)-methyltransferase